MDGKHQPDVGFEDDFSPTDLDLKESLPTDKGTSIPRIIPAPVDPLRNMIHSDKYIESLEKKLQKFKGKQSAVVKGKDMITSLQNAKQEHFTMVINSDQTEVYQSEEFGHNNSVAFSIQRKVNPEKQALNPQELLPLVNDDILAKVSEVEEENGSEVT